MSTVLAGVKISSCAIVRVIKAQAGRVGCEGDAATAMGANPGRALFRGAVDVSGDFLAVPVKLLWRIRVVEDVDGDWLAFLEAQQWTRELAVVGRGRDDAVGRDFDRVGLNADGVAGASAVLHVRRLAPRGREHGRPP